MPKAMFVYILTNAGKTVLYTGVTNNLSRRLWEHEEGIKSNSTSFSAQYRACHLLYFEYFDSPRQAIDREKQIKGMSRAKKEALISATNPEWKFLNDEIEPEGW